MLIERIKAALTPARIHSLTTDALALAAFITAITGSLPANWQNGALAAAAMIVKVANSAVFQHFNSKWETSPAGQETLSVAVHDFPPGQDPFGGSGADEHLGAHAEPDPADTLLATAEVGTAPVQEAPLTEEEFRAAGLGSPPDVGGEGEGLQDDEMEPTP